MGRQYHGLIVDDDECMGLLVSAHIKLDSALAMLNEARSARDLPAVSFRTGIGHGAAPAIDVVQGLIDEAAVELDAVGRTLTSSGR